MASEGRSTAAVHDGDSAVRFFSGFGAVVLIGNSEGLDIEAVRKGAPDGALFVFFNKTYKVLGGPFSGPSMLVARSGTAGANIVHRREVDEVLRPLRSGAFHGVLNLKVGTGEVLSPAEAFNGAPAGHLDLVSHFEGFYPATHLPTSGFALASFLAQTCPQQQVVLAGFTARRSAQWKLFHDHDWTFEQIVLRLLYGRGLLHSFEGGGEAPELDAISARFPQIDRQDIALVAGEVLSERLEGANLAIDRLVSLTRPQSRLDAWLRSIKPATRKQRLARKAGKGA